MRLSRKLLKTVYRYLFFLFQIIEYRCGICEDLAFKSRNACYNHLQEQHSGISWKCNICHKIFRRNTNPHQCRAREEDFFLFSTTTGASRNEAARELERFHTRANNTLILVNGRSAAGVPYHVLILSPPLERGANTVNRLTYNAKRRETHVLHLVLVQFNLLKFIFQCLLSGN